MIGNKEEIYSWVFIYNPYAKVWMSTHRDNYRELFNNFDSDKVLKSKNPNTLKEIIIEGEGNLDKIKKLITT